MSKLFMAFLLEASSFFRGLCDEPKKSKKAGNKTFMRYDQGKGNDKRVNEAQDNTSDRETPIPRLLFPLHTRVQGHIEVKAVWIPWSHGWEACFIGSLSFRFPHRCEMCFL